MMWLLCVWTWQFTKSQTDMKDDMITSKSTRQFDVDAEYETIIEQLKIDDYQLSRIPRPEDKNEVTKKPKINWERSKPYVVTCNERDVQ